MGKSGGGPKFKGRMSLSPTHNRWVPVGDTFEVLESKACNAAYFLSRLDFLIWADVQCNRYQQFLSFISFPQFFSSIFYLNKVYFSEVCFFKCHIPKCIFPKCIYPTCIFAKCNRLACLLLLCEFILCACSTYCALCSYEPSINLCQI